MKDNHKEKSMLAISSRKTLAFALVLLSGVLYALFDERVWGPVIPFLLYPFALLLLVLGLLVPVPPSDRKQLFMRLLGIRFALDVSVSLFTTLCAVVFGLLLYLDFLEGTTGFFITVTSLVIPLCALALANGLYMYCAARRIAKILKIEIDLSYIPLIFSVATYAVYVVFYFTIPRDTILEVCTGTFLRTLAYWIVSIYILKSLPVGTSGRQKVEAETAHGHAIQTISESEKKAH